MDIPRVLGNRYEVGDLIGRGGMAEVHLGYDTRLSRTVAIKILRSDMAQDATFLARFRREAQSAAALNHPSIVSVYDTAEETVYSSTGEEVPLPYIVMEYVKGRTVASLLENGDPVPIAEAVQIVVGVLNALEYSHREGIIHRDIKPGNIMLTMDGKVKVMDFGIARAVADSAATVTQTNSVVGTAQYLSPEQARGEVVDARSDLYSTGAVLYELLTGRPPFIGDSAVAVAYQHVSTAPTPASEIASDIPDSIDRVVMKSLAKRREDRYQNAAEFRTDLLAAARGEGVEAPAVTTWTPAAAFAATQVQTIPGTGTGTAAPAGNGTGTGTMSATGTQPGTEDASTGGRTKRSRKRRWLLTLAIILIVAAIAGIVWMATSGGFEGPTPSPSVTSSEPATATVPTLTNMSESQARTAVENAGLIFARGTDISSNTVEKGLAVSSNPAFGTEVQQGSTVRVSFSSGPESVQVPDLTGMTTAQASQALQNVGLIIGSVTNVDDPSQDKDRIVTQTPEADSTVDPGSSVNVQIASGLVVVPDLGGMTESEASQALSDAGLLMGAISDKTTTNKAQDGTVVPGSQSASANSSVVRKTVVTFDIYRYQASSTPEPSGSTAATSTPTATASATH